MTYAACFQRASRSVVLAALLLAGHFSHAAAPADTAKVSRLIDASGIAHSVRQLLPVIVTGFDDPQQDIPVQVRAALRDAATQAFQPDPMIERVRARLGAALNARELDDTLAWLDGPLGRRITAMENEASEPAALGPMQAYIKELEKRPPSKQRVGLIADLNRASGSSELAAAIVEGTALATALGINASLPAQQRVPADALRRQIKSSLAEVLKQTDQMVTVSMFYAYRALSDQELESYLKFLKSPSGAAYSKATVAALKESVLEATGRFMQSLPKSLERHKGTKGV